MKLKKQIVWAWLIMMFASTSAGFTLLYETPETHAIASLLKVYQAYDTEGPMQLLRLGNTHDGGYIVAERALVEADVIMGYGIGNDISFEDAASKIYGKLAYGFDCMCPSIKSQQALCHFIPSCIASDEWMQQHPERQQQLSSLDQQIETLGIKNKKLFVKMDIEGNEYKTMPDILRHASDITGIVLELHFMELMQISQTLHLLQMLEKDFLLIHVHGNNFCKDCFITTNSTGCIPRVIELSYINKNLVQAYEIAPDQTHPTKLDMPNNPDSLDAVFKILN